MPGFEVEPDSEIAHVPALQPVARERPCDLTPVLHRRVVQTRGLGALLLATLTLGLAAPGRQKEPDRRAMLPPPVR